MTIDYLKLIENELRNVIVKLGINENDIDFIVEIPKDISKGDYATNLAMKLAKVLHKAPLIIAQEIKELIDIKKINLSKIEIANPGFINFFIDVDDLLKVVPLVIKESNNYGSSLKGNNELINLEFVSANPTGYLHVGHGRGAAFGDSLANLLVKIGYRVNREHYVNDAGNQILNMANSVYERYKELFGLPFNLNEDMYHGSEIIEIAKEIKQLYNDKFIEHYDVSFFKDFGTKRLLNNLKEDLHKFNVNFDTWFSEKSLYENNEVQNTLEYLEKHNFIYELDNAKWLKTTLYNDDKDRVIVKSDGSFTYLLPDIAYHKNKLSRGYDHLIDVFGADHHGYIDRLKAAVSMVGGNSNLIDVEILQMVRVLENGEEVKMSKRSGKAITLNDLMLEAGTDALRYFYVSKSLSTHMDLDLDLMKKKSNENPVFYAQYAYARIASIFRMYETKYNKEFHPVTTFTHLNKVNVKNICLTLLNYPNVIEEAATKHLVHKVTHYIDEISYQLHSYYNDEKIISDNDEETVEKLTVLFSIQIVLKNALSIIGVSSPEQM